MGRDGRRRYSAASGPGLADEVNVAARGHLLAGLAVTALVLGLVLQAANGSLPGPTAESWVLIPLAIGFPVDGAAIARQQAPSPDRLDLPRLRPGRRHGQVHLRIRPLCPGHQARHGPARGDRGLGVGLGLDHRSHPAAQLRAAAVPRRPPTVTALAPGRLARRSHADDVRIRVGLPTRAAARLPGHSQPGWHRCGRPALRAVQPSAGFASRWSWCAQPHPS